MEVILARRHQGSYRCSNLRALSESIVAKIIRWFRIRHEVLGTKAERSFIFFIKEALVIKCT